jgi:hypothetical protein
MVAMPEKNYEKKSPSPLEQKPKPKPDVRPLGGVAIKGAGGKNPGK